MNRSPWLGMGLLLAVAIGCGTADYEKRLSGARQRLTQDSVFSQMHAARDLPDVPISVQVGPKDFGETPLDAQADPRRRRPPLADTAQVVTNLKATYEGFVTDSDGGKMPFYCYLVVIDAANAGNRDPKLSLRIDFQGPFAQGVGDWAPVQCAGPDGRAAEWQRLEVTGDQDFYYQDKDGKEDYRRMPGKIQFYSRNEGNYILMIGWRLPTAIEANVELAKWAPLVAGSVVVR